MKLGLFCRGFLGNYKIEAEIGEGAFGKVFQARGHGGQALAVKILHEPLDVDAQRRFAGERAMLAPLQHPNIIDLVDQGVLPDGHPWYAMPLMKGGTLADVIGRARTWDEVLQRIGEIAKGLAAFHAVRGIHRDIKPENILIASDGTAKIADFGLARCEVFSGKSVTRTAAGTPAYMAPEVWKNQAIEDSDIYSLGIILWELVHGSRHQVPACPPNMQDLGSELEPMRKLYGLMTAENPAVRPSALQVATACDRMIAWRKRGEVPAETSPVVAGLAILGGVTLAVAVGIGLAMLIEAAVADERT